LDKPGFCATGRGHGAFVTLRAGDLTHKTLRAASRFDSAQAERLAADLSAAVKGEVRFDAGSRALYAADASNYRQVPIGVVVPRDEQDVVEALRICRAHGAPILARGGGTSQNGQCVNVAVVIDASKYLNRVRSIDPAARTALVEPGVVCDALRRAAERHGLTFGPDPATHSRCTLGGMIGNNSCGAHSVMAGKTDDNIEALEVLTYDGARFWAGATSDAELAAIVAAGGRRGEIYAQLEGLAGRYGDLIRARFPKIKRRVSGYNLDQLLPENGFHVGRALVGSEGTCALTLAAKAKLVQSPPHRVLLVLGYDDIYEAAEAVPAIMRHRPTACEGLDHFLIGGLQRRGLRAADVALLPAGQAWLMIEFGGESPAEAVEKAHGVSAGESGRLLLIEPAMQARVWSLRETAASHTALSIDAGVPDPAVGWEDAAVDPLRLADYLRAFQALVDRHGYRTSLYGHFGDGCVHARITFDLRTPEGVRQWRGFLREAAELVVAHGGSLSGEHGDGQAKAELLPIQYGPELMAAFREFKAIWDPENRMNPGKLVDPYRVDENLRLGPDYRPVTLATRMAFLSPEGDGFARAMERCIGMGRCRSADGGTMCPSYRATLEERHSPRGRARALAEMLRGEVIASGWKSDEVREALDLCLSCKGCASDCPTHTDVAAYKAEFLSHYYEGPGKWRPRQAHAMGRIGDWAPLAGAYPGLANFLTHAPLVGGVARRLAGIAPERELPRFARMRFRAQFARRMGARRAAPPASAMGARRPRRDVFLWVDTFTNFFEPRIGHAAVDVLEAAGYRVSIGPRRLCCGRPLYDFGMLDLARQRLAAILDALAPAIDAGTPVVGLEPACVSVFRDELLELFPRDARAKRLAAQTTMLSDFLEGAGWTPPALAGSAMVHGHCHHKSVLGMAPEVALLAKTGLELSLPDTGCCGMAGAFGFDGRHYAVSQKIGELAVYPAVRAASEETRIVANGFACREQIRQGTGRAAMHSAELLAAAVRGAA
jgi:FAD/FMN-containing dehydrogenase/Fe-S oxidoreductase